MSYDLELRGANRIPADEIRELLAGRFMRIDGDEASLAIVNEHTGVHFALEALDDCLGFCINFARPSFFAREALYTAIDFGSEFGWTIFDPQIDAEVALDDEQIEPSLQCWRVANRHTFDLVKDGWHADPDVENRHSLGLVKGGRYVDPDLANRTWSYNYDIPDIEHELAALGADLYVPKIWYADIDDEVKRFILVPGVGAMAFPEVDFVVVERAGFLGKKRYERIWYADAVGALAPYERAFGPLGAVRAFACGSQAIDKILPKDSLPFTKDQGIPEWSLVDDPAFVQRSGD
jgi:hypothetical protein